MMYHTPKRSPEKYLKSTKVPELFRRFWSSSLKELMIIMSLQIQRFSILIKVVIFRQVLGRYLEILLIIGMHNTLAETSVTKYYTTISAKQIFSTELVQHKCPRWTREILDNPIMTASTFCQVSTRREWIQIAMVTQQSISMHLLNIGNQRIYSLRNN